MPAKRVFVIDTLKQGGAQRLVIDDTNAAFAAGEDVYLLTLAKEAKTNSLESFSRLPAERRVCIPMRSLFDFHGWKQVFCWFREIRPTAVYTHLWFSNFVGRIAAKKANVSRIIAFEHNVYDDVKPGWQFFLDRLLLRWTNKIVAVSTSVSQSLERHGIPVSKIVVLPNAVNLNLYRMTVDRAAVRAELGLPKDAIVCACVARLIHQKGIDVLLHALKELPTNVHVVLIGEGSLRGELEALTKTLGLSERVHFLGARTDVPRLLASADIFVLPSRWEGMPVALLEGMAAGLPIVACAVNGTQEIIRSSEEGILVSPEQPQALAHALMSFVDDASLRQKLGAAALKRAQDFSIEKHLKTLLSLS